MNNLPRILVMMASYNGAKYLPEQIDSILAQRNVDVTLLICDDGSTDNTCDICESYARRTDKVVFSRNKANKGLARNFMDMVYRRESDGYDLYAFSDQDDVWLPDKLYWAANALKRVMDAPALYYTDVENVDERLLGGEREYSRFAKCSQDIVAALTVNWASGCTMVFNKRLRRLLMESIPPEYERIHDGWVHLVALSCGVVIPDLGHSYIKRRISGNNQVGVRNLEETENLFQLRKRWNRLFRESEHSQSRVAGHLVDGYLQYMDSATAGIVKDFSLMPESFSARTRIATCLLGCEFPNRGMNKAYAFKALLNRL